MQTKEESTKFVFQTSIAVQMQKVKVTKVSVIDTAESFLLGLLGY